jgi:hypothetical protein
LLAALPSWVAAVAGLGLRWLNITAVSLVGLDASACELFVRYSSDFTF